MLLSACGTDNLGPAPSTPSMPVPQTTAASAAYTSTEVQVGNVRLPQVGGGDPRVRERFNNAMRASLADVTADPSTTVGNAQLPFNAPEASRVTRRGPRALAGVLITSRSFGGPHPVNNVGTVAIDTETAQPIRADALYVNPAQARATLAALAPTLVPDTAPTLSPPQPTPDNFANWTPSPQGLIIYFPVTHAAGDYQAVLFPWNQIRALMNPTVLATLTD